MRLSACFFSPLFLRSVCMLLLYAPLCVSVSLCVIPASTRSVCMALCVSVRLSACIWCGVSASLHPFFRLLRLYAALCVSLRLSASLYIYLLFAFFPPFYRLFSAFLVCLLCPALRLSVALPCDDDDNQFWSGRWRRLKNWHRSVAPPCDDDDNQFCQEDGATYYNTGTAQWRHHVMMMITSFVRKMAPLEELAPLSGATM